jgi:hypothetical protein
MKLIKEYYKSMFYFFYKLDFVMGYPWWSEIKAIVIIMAIEVLIMYSINGFVLFITDFDIFSFVDMKVYNITSVAILTTIHYWQFFIKKNWKTIVKEYEEKPSKQRNKNYIKMFGVNLVVIFLFVLSMRLVYVSSHA